MVLCPIEVFFRDVFMRFIAENKCSLIALVPDATNNPFHPGPRQRE